MLLKQSSSQPKDFPKNIEFQESTFLLLPQMALNSNVTHNEPFQVIRYELRDFLGKNCLRLILMKRPEAVLSIKSIYIGQLSMAVCGINQMCNVGHKKMCFLWKIIDLGST